MGRLVRPEQVDGGGGTYTNANPSVISVGGIDAGTTFSGVSMQDMWDMLLYPTLYPTLTAPSNTFSLTESGYREIGEVVATLHFSASFNRGSISPAYGTSGYRSGLPNEYNYTGTGLSDYTSTSLTDSQTVNNYTVLLGAQSWTSSVDYDAGEQPLDSEGGNYSTPLAAGTTSAKTVTITGVYPFYATTVAITTLTKQTLVSHSSSYFSVDMIEESGSDKQTVDFPTAFSAITGIQYYDTVSSTWKWINSTAANSLLTFTTSSTTHDVQGNTINYTRYTHNGATIGARLLRFYTT